MSEYSEPLDFSDLLFNAPTVEGYASAVQTSVPIEGGDINPENGFVSPNQPFPSPSVLQPLSGHRDTRLYVPSSPYVSEQDAATSIRYELSQEGVSFVSNKIYSLSSFLYNAEEYLGMEDTFDGPLQDPKPETREALPDDSNHPSSKRQPLIEAQEGLSGGLRGSQQSEIAESTNIYGPFSNYHGADARSFGVHNDIHEANTTTYEKDLDGFTKPKHSVRTYEALVKEGEISFDSHTGGNPPKKCKYIKIIHGPCRHKKKAKIARDAAQKTDADAHLTGAPSAAEKSKSPCEIKESRQPMQRKRPINAFMAYVSHQREALRDTGCTPPNNQEFIRNTSITWKAMSKEQREPFLNLASNMTKSRDIETEQSWGKSTISIAPIQMGKCRPYSKVPNSFVWEPPRRESDS